MPVRALFVDAVNTLLRPREPVGVTYARFAREAGIEGDPVVVEARFRQAMSQAEPVPDDHDGRRFWRPLVATAVGSEDEALFESIWRHYEDPRAWWIEAEALTVLGAIARSGVRLGIISNFDSRLRTLYNRFALDRMFTVLICSAEVGAEKPDPLIFHIACEVAGVLPRDAVHVGDDPVRDVEGARAAGLTGLRYDFELGWAAIGAQVQRLRMPFLLR